MVETTKAMAVIHIYVKHVVFAVCLLQLFANTTALGGNAPDAEQLMIGYYRDTGHDRLNGKAVLLTETYNPILTAEQLLPPQSSDPSGGLTKKEIGTALQYYKDYYDVNLGDSGRPEHRYSVLRIYYDKGMKRKDYAPLSSKSEYEDYLNSAKDVDSAYFDRYYDDGVKMTSISDQGEFTANDPQGIIENAALGIPKIHGFGKVRASPEDGEAMVGLIESGHFQLSGEETEQGYRAVMVANQGFLTRVEVLFDPNKNYIVKEIKNYARGELFDHKIYTDYTQTEGGEYAPRKIINRRYAPWYMNALRKGITDQELVAREPLLTFEEITVVREVDYNTDIPADTFIPVFTNGTTIYDTSVDPPMQYVYGLSADEMQANTDLIDDIDIAIEYPIDDPIESSRPVIEDKNVTVGKQLATREETMFSPIVLLLVVALGLGGLYVYRVIRKTGR